MMIDRERVRELIQDTTLTQGDIGRIIGCSVATVFRIARELGLSPGQGIHSQSGRWIPSESSDIAYALGSYITDGHISRGRNGKPNTIVLSVVAREFSDAYAAALTASGLHPSIGTRAPGRLSAQHQNVVSVYSTRAASWFLDQCSIKSRIPPFVLSGDAATRLAFVAGVIDGDGHVTKEGSIRVRGVDDWLLGLPALLNPIGIRTTGPTVTKVLESGREYRMVSIRRSDFRDAGGWCSIPEKAQRIASAVDVRGYRGNRPTSPCPKCGEPMSRSKTRVQCSRCYRSSPEFAEHLRRIAKNGNIAANKARWWHQTP